jgi:hypothetical protein
MNDLGHLRRHAAAYLREVEAHVPEAAIQPLQAAAAFYDEEANALEKLTEVCQQAVDAGEFFASLVKEAAGFLHAALAADRKAIRAIEAALAAWPERT